MSEEVGKETGWMAAKVVSKEDQLMPPVNGWEHHVGGGKWESDPTLVCSREVSPVCKEVRIESVALSLFVHLVYLQNNSETIRLVQVRVELRGDAKKVQGHWAGIYLPVEGKINRGRWVGSYQQHSLS